MSAAWIYLCIWVSQGCDTTQGGMIIREFSDYGSIFGYTMDTMTWAVNTGVISGYEDKTLAPRPTPQERRWHRSSKLFRECLMPEEALAPPFLLHVVQENLEKN